MGGWVGKGGRDRCKLFLHKRVIYHESNHAGAEVREKTKRSYWESLRLISLPPEDVN